MSASMRRRSGLRLIGTTTLVLFLLAALPASGLTDTPTGRENLKRHRARKHKKKRRLGVRLGGPQGKIATKSVQDVFRVQRQTPAFVSRVGKVLVARREIVVEVTPDATTGQVNRMLTSVRGGVVAAVNGARLLLVGIPDPGRVRTLKRTVGRVSRMQGVASAQMSVMAQPDDVPQRISAPPSGSQRKALSHLLASGVAAAWNARGAASSTAAPTVVIGDDFGNGPLSHHVNAAYDQRQNRSAAAGTAGSRPRLPRDRNRVRRLRQ